MLGTPGLPHTDPPGSPELPYVPPVPLPKLAPSDEVALPDYALTCHSTGLPARAFAQVRA